MKGFAGMIALLVLFAFLSGCAQPAEEDEEEQEMPSPTPTPEETPELTEQEENQELDEFDSTLISEDEEMGIGDII